MDYFQNYPTLRTSEDTENCVVQAFSHHFSVVIHYSLYCEILQCLCLNLII
uniref:Uncharacterized protein n=1 Tax=Anguilla anguilla TaxID=7936 RepID=A0A0E9RJI8_ANGAN